MNTVCYGEYLMNGEEQKTVPCCMRYDTVMQLVLYLQ
jgi:hypothetical protein